MFARGLKLTTFHQWLSYARGEILDKGIRPGDIPIHPETAYEGLGWISVGDWLGTGSVAPSEMEYMPFCEAREFVRGLGLKSTEEWNKYCRGELYKLPPKPDNIPRAAYRTYKNKGWISMGDWLGTGTIAKQNLTYLDYEAAKRIVLTLGLKSEKEWRLLKKGLIPGKELPINMPLNPDSVYKKKGWVSWVDWLGNDANQTKSE